MVNDPPEDLELSSTRYPVEEGRRGEGGGREEREERNVAKEIKKMKKRNNNSSRGVDRREKPSGTVKEE